MELTNTFQKIGEVVIGNGGYGNIYFRLYARYIEQSESDNTTIVQYELRHYLPSTYSYITYYSSSQKLTGELTNSSSNSTNKKINPGETTLLTQSKTIEHNEDGSKSISVGASFTNSYFGNTVTINQVSADLPKINRLNTIELNNNEFFQIDKGEYETNEIPVKLTKYVDEYTTNLKLYYETSSDEGTPRYELGERINFEDSSLSFTTEELTVIYNAIPYTRFIRIICIVETYNGETKLGETEYISVGSLSSTDLYPTFTNFEYKDVNTITTNLTKNDQVLIRGYSELQMIVSATNKAVGRKKSSIEIYTFANGTQSEDVTAISYPIASPSFEAQDKVLTVTAIDSRTFATKIEQDLTGKWIEYTNIEKKPFAAERKDSGTSTQVTLKLSGNIWDGDFSTSVPNSIKSATYKYKKTSDTEWIKGTTILNVVKNGSTYSLEQDIAGDLGAIGFDQEESYDIYVEVSDQLSTVTDTFTLGSGSPGIARYKNCVALGAPYNEQLGGRTQVPEITGDVNVKGKISSFGKEVALKEDIQEIESGINENENWVKFPDGTMICGGNFKISGITTSSWGTMQTAEIDNPITFPVEFKEIKSVSVTCAYDDYAFWVHRVLFDTKGITNLQISRPTSVSNVPAGFTYIAVGRWK